MNAMLITSSFVFHVDSVPLRPLFVIVITVHHYHCVCSTCSLALGKQVLDFSDDHGCEPGSSSGSMAQPFDDVDDDDDDDDDDYDVVSV